MDAGAVLVCKNMGWMVWSSGFQRENNDRDNPFRNGTQNVSPPFCCEGESVHGFRSDRARDARNHPYSRTNQFTLKNLDFFKKERKIYSSLCG